MTLSQIVFSRTRKSSFVRHFSFWAGWLFFQALLYAYTPGLENLPGSNRLIISFFRSLIYLFPNMFLAYTTTYFVVRVFLLRKKYIWSVVISIMLVFITAILSACTGIYVIPPLEKYLIRWMGLPEPRQFPYSLTFYLAVLAGLRGSITVGGVFASIKLAHHWIIRENNILSLQKENAEAQLQILKGQIHPHFLFNTLNNIFYQTKVDPEKASKLVTGLSDILRYMLYQGDKPVVLLNQEIRIIKEYITLEYERYGEGLDLSLDFPDDLDADISISPLLLFPLIENCFKHCTATSVGHPWISVSFTLVERTLTVKLINSHGKKTLADKSPGIGLMNVTKRLELLYPGRHSFNIFDDGEIFVADVVIKLHTFN